ncbi:AAA family ATPase [Phreatobacter stygius]|uniref:ATPase n=1 Tax=Phreatobacter stygius TaxID=1940610 RepID=A0A4D7B5R5_9HYPH|nr:AAA family ATPase [Phreatobacter stygius]QCI65440.1 ATPase [Phreatobacter stygius]
MPDHPIHGPGRLFVVTGGPGSGKTTLIDALKTAGLATSEEVGRRIIRDQQAIGGRALPWLDRALFAEMMLAFEMGNYHAAAGQPGAVLFDRGVPDVLGYLNLIGLPIPHHMDVAARTLRYNRRVFIAPPWPEIYRTDGERKQDLDEAARTHSAMVLTYRQYGYELVELPRAPVAARVDFVIATLAGKT